MASQTAQNARRRKQTTVEFSSGNKISKSLGRGMLYRYLSLNLTGQITCVKASNVAAKVGRGDEWAVVKKIELIANGTDVIKSISGKMLRWLNTFWYHQLPNLSTGLTDTGTDNATFNSTLVLPFWMFDSIRPMDTVLDSSLLSSLEIVVTWGTFTDINTDATAFTTAPSIDVYSAEAFGVQGQFSNWRIFEIVQDVPATNSDFQIPLPVSNVYRGFLLALDDAGTEKTGLLNNLQLKSGTNVFADISADVLQAEQTTSRGIDNDSLAQQSGLSSIDGVFFYDHVLDGYMTEAIDTVGLSELTLHLDVTKGTGTTTLIVVPMQVVPVRG